MPVYSSYPPVASFIHTTEPTVRHAISSQVMSPDRLYSAQLTFPYLIAPARCATALSSSNAIPSIPSNTVYPRTPDAMASCEAGGHAARPNKRTKGFTPPPIVPFGHQCTSYTRCHLASNEAGGHAARPNKRIKGFTPVPLREVENTQMSVSW